MKILKSILFTGLFAFSLITFFSCSKNNAELKDYDAQNGVSQTENAQNEMMQAVRAEKLILSNLRKFIELNGNIRAEKSMNVYPVVAGKIAGSAVHLGSVVKKGDVLAYVDPSTPGSRYALNEVTSPINGTVISIPLIEGTRVNTETSIAVIGDLSKLQIIAYIPERYVSYLKKGLKADVLLEAYPQERFSAVVSEVSPVLDEASRTKEIILTFSKNDSRINVGMFAGIKLYIKDFYNVYSVQTSCIIEKNDGKYVYVAEETVGEDVQKLSTVRLVKIKTGEEIQDRTIISFEEEINFNDAKVITQGFENLHNGSRVNIAE